MRIVDFYVDRSEIKIIPLSDWHIGSPQCDEVLIKQVCDYIESHDDVYCILNGDLVDNNLRNSVGNVFDQTMSPLDQVVRAAYYLQGIAKKGKIINMTSGNHEDRGDKEGLSPSQLLLAKLMQYDPSLNERYCEDGAYTFLTLCREANKKHKLTFTIFNLHGNGGGSKIGAKITRLDDMANIIPAHIYIRSHTHQPETHRGLMMSVSLNNHTVREEPCVFINCNAYLKYGGYGAKGGMKPLSRAIPVITLKMKRKQKQNKQEKADNLYRYIDCQLMESLED